MFVEFGALNRCLLEGNESFESCSKLWIMMDVENRQEVIVDSVGFGRFKELKRVCK